MKRAIPARRLAAAWLLVGVCLAALGCGGSSGGVPRMPVFGAVSGPGSEKFAGSINFNPAQGRSGPSAVASVTEGQYRFDEANGPTAGPHQVIITRTVAKAGPKGIAGGPGGKMPPGGKTRWTFSSEVPAKSPYRLDFKLD